MKTKRERQDNTAKAIASLVQLATRGESPALKARALGGLGVLKAKDLLHFPLEPEAPVHDPQSANRSEDGE
jgi:hypothetical protein